MLEIIYTFEKHKYGDSAHYNPYAKQVVIFLPMMESPNELLDTIEHEVLHHCMFSEDLDDEDEHIIIAKMLWSKWL